MKPFYWLIFCLQVCDWSREEPRRERSCQTHRTVHSWRQTQRWYEAASARGCQAGVCPLCALSETSVWLLWCLLQVLFCLQACTLYVQHLSPHFPNSRPANSWTVLVIIKSWVHFMQMCRIRLWQSDYQIFISVTAGNATDSFSREACFSTPFLPEFLQSKENDLVYICVVIPCCSHNCIPRYANSTLNVQALVCSLCFIVIHVLWQASS